MSDEALVHTALLYSDEEQFLETAVPFLEGGLDAGDAVLAVVAEPNVTALRDTMGHAAAPVTFVPAERFYRHPVHTIAAYSRIVHQSLPKRVRALTEPVWHGLTPSQTSEWKRYEAIVNAAFEASGAQVICAYDTRTTAEDVLESTSLTHPMLIEGHGPRCSRHYVHPRAFAAEGDHDPLPPPWRPDVLPLPQDLAGLHTVRAFLTERAIHHGLEQPQIGRCLVAADEVAGNAVEHGAPPMEIRVWSEDGLFFCEVADFGHWRPDPLIGHLPRDPGMGIGLWGVRLLADTVQIRTGWGGTIVRLTWEL